LGTGILLSAGKGLAEGLAGQVIGVGGCALAFPFVAFERREGLGVVGDVGGGARQACAVVYESVLSIGRGAVSNSYRKHLWAPIGLSTDGREIWGDASDRWRREHTGSQEFAEVAPFVHVSGQVFC
jgi:hypothetical protein